MAWAILNKVPAIRKVIMPQRKRVKLELLKLAIMSAGPINADAT